MNKIPALLTLAALACTAHAEDKLGVPVYPGAKAHAQDTAAAKMLASEAYCFRSPDAVAKLVAYYKAQPGLKLMPMPPGVVAVATSFLKGEVITRVQTAVDNPKESVLCIAKE